MNVSSSVSATRDTAATATTTQTQESTRESPTSPIENRASPRGSARLEQQAKLFRDLMSGPTTAGQLAEAAAGARAPVALEGTLTASGGTHGWPGLEDDSREQSVDAAMMLAVEQRVDRGVVAQPGVVHASPDMTFAELVEKHVRRAMASREASGSRGGEMRIELSDAVLPGLSLSLKRTAGGWQLSAASANRDSLDKLSQYAPALVARFARASLGDLVVSLDHS